MQQGLAERKQLLTMQLEHIQALRVQKQGATPADATTGPLPVDRATVFPVYSYSCGGYAVCPSPRLVWRVQRRHESWIAWRLADNGTCVRLLTPVYLRCVKCLTCTPLRRRRNCRLILRDRANAASMAPAHRAADAAREAMPSPSPHVTASAHDAFYHTPLRAAQAPPPVSPLDMEQSQSLRLEAARNELDVALRELDSVSAALEVGHWYGSSLTRRRWSVWRPPSKLEDPLCHGSCYCSGSGGRGGGRMTL